MTSKDSGQDQELLDRYRRASDADPVAPSDAVRSAILAEGRRVAGQLAAKGAAAPFDVARRAANDSRWKITAYGTAGAALLAALLIAPRYWEGLPAAQVNNVPAAQESRTSAAAPAPKLESTAPLAESRERKISKPVQHHAPAPPADAARNPIAGFPKRTDSSDRAVQENLQAAAAAGDVDRATRLLDQGSTVDMRDAQGRTPLLLAVEQNRLAVVRLLLVRGADPNAADNAGRTPLQQAKNKDFREIAGILEEAGAR